jgi:hypothetical protein
MLAYHAIEQQATFHTFDIDQLRARLAASSAPQRLALRSRLSVDVRTACGAKQLRAIL